ncbi:hypothetical protein BVG19_g1679 [[Candida] boidinii]|nr:hypothetical protein BVG19_g1679 [[Candida] boidinii]
MSIDNSKPGDRSSRRLSLLPPIITSTDAIDDNNDGELETVDMNNSISNAQPNQLLNQRSFSSSSTSVDTNSRVPPSPPPRDMTSPPLPKRGNPHTDNPALPPRPSFGSKRRLFSHEEEKRNRSDEERGDDKEGYEKDNYDDDDDDDDDENDQKDDTFQDLASIRRRSVNRRFSSQRDTTQDEKLLSTNDSSWRVNFNPDYYLVRRNLDLIDKNLISFLIEKDLIAFDEAKFNSILDIKQLHKINDLTKLVSVKLEDTTYDTYQFVFNDFMDNLNNNNNEIDIDIHFDNYLVYYNALKLDNVKLSDLFTTDDFTDFKSSSQTEIENKVKSINHNITDTDLLNNLIELILKLSFINNKTFPSVLLISIVLNEKFLKFNKSIEFLKLLINLNYLFNLVLQDDAGNKEIEDQFLFILIHCIEDSNSKLLIDMLNNNINPIDKIKTVINSDTIWINFINKLITTNQFEFFINELLNYGIFNIINLILPNIEYFLSISNEDGDSEAIESSILSNFNPYKKFDFHHILEEYNNLNKPIESEDADNIEDVKPPISSNKRSQSYILKRLKYNNSRLIEDKENKHSKYGELLNNYKQLNEEKISDQSLISKLKVENKLLIDNKNELNLKLDNLLLNFNVIKVNNDKNLKISKINNNLSIEISRLKNEINLLNDKVRKIKN